MITARLPITFVISFAFLLITPLSANAALYGDLNCDASVNVVDVQISILKTLGEPLDVVIDGDLNGIPDACVGDTGTTCGEGTVNADGVCVVDPGTLQDVADAAYAEGYSAGALDTLENIGSYTDGYNDALGICEDLGGSVGVCVNYEDLAILENMEASAMEVIQGDCLQDCLFVGDIESCLGDCVSTVAGLGEECASCFAEEVYCLIQACVTECIDPLSEACGACSTLQGCDTLAYKCAGLPEPPDPSTIGSCENEADNIILASFEESDGLPIECIQGCFFGTDTDGCYLGCFTGVGLSEPCSACYSQYMDCQFTECLTDCVAGQEACDLCLDEAGCNTELDICANGAPPVPVCESPFTELPVTPLNEDAAFQDFQNVCNSGGVLVVIDAEWNQAGPSYFDTYTDLLNVFGDCGLQIVLLYGEDAFMQTADSNTIQNVLENHFESGLPEGMHLAAMEGFGPISMILDFGGSVGLPTILFLDSELDVVPDFNMQADLNYAFFDNYFQGTCEFEVPPEPSVIETCGELYECIFYECEGDGTCIENCADAATGVAMDAYSNWVNCYLPFVDPQTGMFASDLQAVLFPYFTCAAPLAQCLGPEGFNSNATCVEATDCVSACGTSPGCVTNCALQLNYENAVGISESFICAYDACMEEGMFGDSPAFLDNYSSLGACLTDFAEETSFINMNSCQCEDPPPPLPVLGDDYELEMNPVGLSCSIMGGLFNFDVEFQTRWMELTVTESGASSAGITSPVDSEMSGQYSGSFSYQDEEFVLSLAGDNTLCFEVVGELECATVQEELALIYDDENPDIMIGTSDWNLVTPTGVDCSTPNFTVFAYNVN